MRQWQWGLCCLLLGCFSSGTLEAQTPTARVPKVAQGYYQVSSPVLQLRGVQATNEGILLAIDGNPQVSVQRIANPDRLVFDLQGTLLAPNLHGTSYSLNRNGVRQIRLAQFQRTPAIARIVLDLDPNDPNSKLNWQAIPGNGGILLAAVGGANAGSPSPGSQPSPTASATPNIVVNNSGNGVNSALATIYGINLTSSGLLLIQGNQNFSYSGSADPPSGTFNLTIPAAQISPQLKRPTLPANSPIERIRLTQIGSSVVIGVKAAPGWQVRESGRVDSQQIALQLLRAGAQPPVIPGSTMPIPTLPPANSPPPVNLTSRGRAVVVVDPGHGGPDVGAVGNGIYEKNVVLPIGLLLGLYLQQMGYGVVYTRTSDIDLDLEPRVQLSEQVKADVFVSVHANSLESRMSNVSGIETYYAPGASAGQQLASAVHQEIIAGTGANDRGVRSARFYVIRRTSMPAILVETGFVTNPQEAANLNDRSYQERMAAAIARGVDSFVRAYYRR